MKYTSFMFVEDGSVDTEHLISDLKEHNPEIKVVIYRQGSTMPTLISHEEKNRFRQIFGSWVLFGGGKGK